MKAFMALAARLLIACTGSWGGIPKARRAGKANALNALAGGRAEAAARREWELTVTGDRGVLDFHGNTWRDTFRVSDPRFGLGALSEVLIQNGTFSHLSVDDSKRYRFKNIAVSGNVIITARANINKLSFVHTMANACVIEDPEGLAVNDLYTPFACLYDKAVCVDGGAYKHNSCPYHITRKKLWDLKQSGRPPER